MKTSLNGSSSNLIAGLWPNANSNTACAITLNNFVYKSLSNWALNVAVGCGHACQFCYVPSASVNKQADKLAQLGVGNPDADWGNYVFLREWDETVFLRSLRAAQKTPLADLKPDGNRAVLLCSTTDAFQVIHHPDAAVRAKLQDHLHFVVQRSLELIRDHSDLNVRILTRSPLVRDHFDVLRSLGNRALLGMSIPTLNPELAKIYEPKAPSPRVRIETLKAAATFGIPIFVALAPTYPECDEADLKNTLSAVASLNPQTVFHEPINIRAENIARIEAHASELGRKLRTEVFADRDSWRTYALDSLKTVERVAGEVGIGDRLHLWPDKSLGNGVATRGMTPAEVQIHQQWLSRWWGRISEWPGKSRSS